MSWVDPTAVVADMVMKGRTPPSLPETEAITGLQITQAKHKDRYL
jgi:hypothetical protein